MLFHLLLADLIKQQSTKYNFQSVVFPWVAKCLEVEISSKSQLITFFASQKPLYPINVLKRIVHVWMDGSIYGMNFQMLCMGVWLLWEWVCEWEFMCTVHVSGKIQFLQIWCCNIIIIGKSFFTFSPSCWVKLYFSGH